MDLQTRPRTDSTYDWREDGEQVKLTEDIVSFEWIQQFHDPEPRCRGYRSICLSTSGAIISDVRLVQEMGH